MNELGRLGEDIVCRYLSDRGYRIVSRNYRKKWGEIDVITTKGGILHFIEVKAVSRENLDSISQETNSYRPEDNAHPEKLRRLARTVETYLLEKGVEGGQWRFDVAAVYIDQRKKKAKVSLLENVIL